MEALQPVQVGSFVSYWLAGGVAGAVILNVCGVLWFGWVRWFEDAVRSADCR